MYATGSATSCTDALKKLVTFLVSAGWTTDMSATEGAGWRAHLHKSGNYIHLRASENEQPWAAEYSNLAGYAIDLYMGTGFNSGQPWYNQVAGAPNIGYPGGVGAPLSAGPFPSYHFFSDSSGDNIVVVIEQSTGKYKHFGWGASLNKAGSYTGGQYFFAPASGYVVNVGFQTNAPGFDLTASCPGTGEDSLGGVCLFVRADVDSFTGAWIGCAATTSSQAGYTGKVGSSSVFGTTVLMPQAVPVYAYSATPYEFQYLQTSLQDDRANLLPVLIWVTRDGGTTGRTLLGDIPNVFSTNAVGNGFAQGSDYVLGADTYKLFWNFAVKKVP